MKKYISKAVSVFIYLCSISFAYGQQYYCFLPGPPCANNTPILIMNGGSQVTNMTNIQWYINGVQVPGANSPNLVISTSGSYSATFNIGSNSYTATAVNITAIPVATLNITGSRYFIPGQSVNFTANLSTSPTGPVKWYVNGIQTTLPTTNLTDGAVITATYTNVCGQVVNSSNSITMSAIPSLWSMGTNSSVYYTNNVGIGTATPQNQLVNTSKASFGGNALITGNEPIEAQGLGAGISLYDRVGGLNERWIIYSSETAGAGTNTLRFFTGGSDKMGITPSGNLGIGTATPSDILQIVPTATQGGITISQNSGSGGYTAMTMGVSAVSGGYSYISSIKSSGSAYGDLIINGTAGNVGIGTTTPQAKLDISGNIVADGLALSRSGGTSRGTIWFNYVGDNNQKLYNNKYNVDNEGPFDGMKWNVNSGIQIRTGTAGNIHALSIDALGNVIFGAGTSVLVDIYGNTNFHGNVQAKAYRACLQPGQCPDYVFEKEYQLKSLEEVEKYINANKHLPEVPSAKEMESNGMEIKEMNLLLLKKVEEQTLHMIQMSKTIQALDKQLKEVKAQIKK